MILSDLNLDWQLLAVVAGVTLVAVWISWSNIRYFLAKTVPVRRKSRLLSVSERNLFDCLVRALSDTYFIFSKVGIKHVIEQSPGAPSLDVKRVHDDIKDQYFDFILCRKDDMSIFGVVELEQSGTGKGSRQQKKRTKLVSRLCKSANLKLFYFDVRQDYKSMDIARLVTGVSKIAGSPKDQLAGTHRSQLTVEDPSQSTSIHIRSCPKCRGELVTKVALKGRSIGERFLMCNKYPFCDYRIALKDLQELSKPEPESGGFNNWT